MHETPHHPETGNRKFGLPAIWSANTRLLILGSLPGDYSLAHAQYYAHPRNQFWTLLGDVTELDLTGMAYAERLQALTQRGIGLWDVVHSATRPGSLDSALRTVNDNPLNALISRMPHVRAVAFNGLTASQRGCRLLSARPDISLINLPSSSPAYTVSLESKRSAWSVLRTILAEHHDEHSG